MFCVVGVSHERIIKYSITYSSINILGLIGHVGCIRFPLEHICCTLLVCFFHLNLKSAKLVTESSTLRVPTAHEHPSVHSLNVVVYIWVKTSQPLIYSAKCDPLKGSSLLELCILYLMNIYISFIYSKHITKRQIKKIYSKRSLYKIVHVHTKHLLIPTPLSSVHLL